MPQANIGASTLSGDQVLQTLVERFLTTPPDATFLDDLKDKEIIKDIGISVWSTRQSSEGKLAKPKLKTLERKKLWNTLMRLRRHRIVTAVGKNMKFPAETPKTKFSRPRLTTN